jgi:multimeric flavodoxin WrbA
MKAKNGCKKAGICSIRDDFDHVREQIPGSYGVMLASPIFFYSMSAQTKIFIDRFQIVFTFSIHGEKNFPFHKETSDLDIGLEDSTGDIDYLTALEAELQEAWREPEMIWQFTSPGQILARATDSAVSVFQRQGWQGWLKGTK